MVEPEEPSAILTVTQLDDGSFFVDYNVTKTGYYDLKLMLDGLDLGPKNCISTFDGTPQACTVRSICKL